MPESIRAHSWYIHSSAALPLQTAYILYTGTVYQFYQWNQQNTYPYGNLTRITLQIHFVPATATS